MSSLPAPDGISIFFVRLPHLRHAMPHTHPFHEFYFSLSSGGTQFADGASYDLRPGQFFSLPAGVPHVCMAWKSAYPVDAVVIYLHEGVFLERGYGDADTCRILKRVLSEGREGRHDIDLSAGTAERLKELLVRLCDEREEWPGYRAARKAGLQELFLHLLRDPAHRAALVQDLPEARERFERLFLHLQNHFTGKQTVEAAAKRCGLSRSHFHALFREATGITFVRYVNRMRVEFAKQLLRETDLPIAEVALAAGFEQLAHFYRCFQQETGHPPGHWRSRQKNGARGGS